MLEWKLNIKLQGHGRLTLLPVTLLGWVSAGRVLMGGNGTASHVPDDGPGNLQGIPGKLDQRGQETGDRETRKQRNKKGH